MSTNRTRGAFAAPDRPTALPQVPSVRARKPVSARAVGSFVPRITRKAFEKYGFAAATLLTDWPAIVGADLAAFTEPQRLKWPRAAGGGDSGAADAEARPGATLELRVDGARALDVQYRARQITDRINAYFGYRAVDRLRLIQAPIARPAEAPRRVLPQARKATVGPDLAGIADERLREALARLAACVASDSGPGR